MRAIPVACFPDGRKPDCHTHVHTGRLVYYPCGVPGKEFSDGVLGSPMTNIDLSTKLVDLFSANRGRNWYFVSPGGNWGDHLIYAGAESLARSLGLHWTTLDYRNIERALPPGGAGIYIHGGGGLNPWSSGRAFATLRSALNVPDSLVIQGPQTCDTESDQTKALFAVTFAKLLSAEIHFFARETTSANLLAQILPSRVALHLDHDTAFHLPKDELLALSRLRETPEGRYRLLVSREDDEAPSGSLIAGKDVIQFDPANSALTFSHWLRIHAFASHIISNRLHSAIVGTLLGKSVELLPGNYHKNRSVWEFSLKQRGVKWCERIDGPPVPESSLGWLPRRVRNSWKVQMALLRIHGLPLS